MSTIYELEAELRDEQGKGASRRLRRLDDKIPAIIYGAGKKPEIIQLSHKNVAKSLENEGFYSHILTIILNGKKEQVVLKDLQRHPYKRKILHADFLRIKANEALIRRVPLHFIGEEVAPGVKQGGGKAFHYVAEIEVRCLPANLPEFITVDISKLTLNKTIHAKDLLLSEGVELAPKVDPDMTIINIHIPKAAKAAGETDTEVTPVETEITGEKAKEESEE